MSLLQKVFIHKGHEVHQGILKGEIQNLEIRRKMISKKFGLFGMFRDASPYLATRRKAELIPPYIWRIATPIPNEPKFVTFVSLVVRKGFCSGVNDASSRDPLPAKMNASFADRQRMRIRFQNHSRNS